jgi:hypothetical protein
LPVELFQMIGQRALTSRGKMVAALNQANVAPSVIVFHWNESAAFAFFDRHSGNDRNTHTRGRTGIRNGGSIRTRLGRLKEGQPVVACRFFEREFKFI